MKTNTIVTKMLSGFRFGRYHFFLTADNNGMLPGYKGSTIRGAFGMALRRMSCVAGYDKDCRKCMIFENCMYAQTFESINNTQKNKDKFLGRYDYISHPFIFLDKSNGKREINKGDNMEFELILIGSFIEKLPYYIYAIKIAAENGFGKKKAIKFKIETVKDDKDNIIYAGTSDKLESSYKENFLTGDKIIKKKENIKKLKLEFLTPVRIKSDEKLVKKINFKIFVTALLRRLSILAEYYAGIDAKINAADYLKKSENIKTVFDGLRWYDWERYSNRQNTRMKMGGLIGEIVFEGKELKKYMPLIRMGEYLHVGKGTSFGLGKYKIQEE